MSSSVSTSVPMQLAMEENQAIFTKPVQEAMDHQESQPRMSSIFGGPMLTPPATQEDKTIQDIPPLPEVEVMDEETNSQPCGYLGLKATDSQKYANFEPGDNISTIYEPSPPSSPSPGSSSSRTYDDENEWPSFSYLAQDHRHLVTDKLRKNISRQNFRGSGYQDHDKTGNYDPAEERRRNRQKAKRRRVEEEEEEEEGDDVVNDEVQAPVPKKPNLKSSSYEYGRMTGKSKIVNLPATSLRVREYLKQRAQQDENGNPKLNHELEGQSMIDRSLVPGVAIKANARSASLQKGSRDELDEFADLLGHREARGCKQCLQLSIDCSLVDDSGQYPCTACQEDENDCQLIILPTLKRPCERCQYRRIHCSYRDDYGEGVEACHECQEKGVSCLAGPLKSCRLEEVLAKSKGKTAVKAKPTENAENTGRPFLACTLCRQNKVSCSLRSMTQQGPCKACRDSGSACTFEPVRKSGIERNSNKKKKSSTFKTTTISNKYDFTSNKSRVSTTKLLAHEKALRIRNGSNSGSKSRYGNSAHYLPPFSDSSDSESSGNPKLLASVRGGRVGHIRTSFCHPIVFNYIPPPTETPESASNHQCSFCVDPGIRYALFGLEELRVEVIQWDNVDTGFEELSGGWSERGAVNTKMCSECTLERILIITCAEHRIRRINGLDPRTFDYQAAYREMLGEHEESSSEIVTSGTPRAPAEKNAKTARWCSLCVNPAFYECCTAPPFDKFATPMPVDADFGCGLQLCEVCARRMVPEIRTQRQPYQLQAHTHNQARPEIPNPVEGFKTGLSLDEMVVYVISQKYNPVYAYLIRADISFLSSQGELMRRSSLATSAEGNSASGNVERTRDITRGHENQAWKGMEGGGDLKGKLAKDKIRKTIVEVFESKLP